MTGNSYDAVKGAPTEGPTPAPRARRHGAFNMAGSISDILLGIDRNGRDYARARFTTTVKGKVITRLALAFGAGYEAIRASLSDGPIRLYGRFDGGTFHVIGLGQAPRSHSRQPTAAPSTSAVSI